MGGITGYVGYRQAVLVLLGSLKKLEYRGYDSAGIAVLHRNELFVCKAKGQLRVLAERLESKTINGSLEIGIHAGQRTASRRIPSHPHTDVSRRVVVVHNGVIENYAQLKEWLQARNVVFQSDTDTEVIARLINYYYQARVSGGANLLSAVLESLKRLEGSYASRSWQETF